MSGWVESCSFLSEGLTGTLERVQLANSGDRATPYVLTEVLGVPHQVCDVAYKEVHRRAEQTFQSSKSY